MINRYFQQNALISGPLQFLAGFAQRRQEVHNIEAGLQAQQDQQNAESIGQGILTAGQGIGRGLAVRGQNRQESRLAGQRAQSLMDLENLRSANDLMQFAERARFGALGIPTTASPRQFAGAASQIPAADIGSGSAGSAELQSLPIGPNGLPIVLPGGIPDAGAAGGGGAPPVQPQSFNTANLDPMHVQAYQRASNRLAELNTEYDNVMTSSRPPQEKYSAVSRLIPAIAEQRALQQRYQRPPPPTTEPELIQAGANGGGFTRLSDGQIFYRDGDGKAHVTQGRKDDYVPKTASTVERTEYMVASMGGVENYNRMIEAGGIPILKPNGEVSVEWPKQPGESQLSKEYDDAVKVLTTRDEDGTHPPTPDQVKQYILDKQAALEELRTGKKKAPPPGVTPPPDTRTDYEFLRSIIGETSPTGLVPQIETPRVSFNTPTQEDAKATAQRTFDAIMKKYPDPSQVPPEIAGKLRELAQVLRQ